MYTHRMSSLLLVLVVLLLGGCPSPANVSNNVTDVDQPDPGPNMEPANMQLTCADFADGGVIPSQYTGVGEDVSPPLAWSNAPQGVKSFALLCEDPDAPSRAAPRPEGPWVHWVLYNIAADRHALPKGVPHGYEPAGLAGARQGRNDFGSNNIGYRGPMPPTGSGPHRYFFQVFALDCELRLAPEQANKKSLIDAMQNHVLDQGQLIGTFERR